MSKKSGSDEDGRTGEFNRRKVLQMMGAGTVGAAGLGLVPQNTRAAETDIDLREVNGSEKHKLVAIARQTDKYSALSTHLKKKRDLVSTGSNIDVFEVRGEDGLDYQIVDFRLKYVGSGSKGPNHKADIAIILQEQSFHNSKSYEVEYDLNDSRSYEVQDSTGDSQNEYSVDLTEFDVDSGELSEDHQTNHYSVPNKGSDTGGDFVTTAGAACQFCKAVGNVICNVGCGAGVGLICGLVGLTGPAGIACGAVVSAICGFIYTAADITLGQACGVDQAGEYLCNRSGYC